jgi:hypothetical protein
MILIDIDTYLVQEMFRKKREDPETPSAPSTSSTGGAEVPYRVNEAPNIDLTRLNQEPDWTSELTGTKLAIGTEMVVQAISSMIARVKSSVIVIMPVPRADLVDLVIQVARANREKKYFLTSYWDGKALAQGGNELKSIGNVQLRQIRVPGEYWAASRDAEEVLIAPAGSDVERVAGLHSIDPGYCKMFAQFIGPMFMANSIPVK